MGRESFQPSTGTDSQSPGVRERASIVCLHENRLLVIRYREPGTGNSFVGPPGGALEAGEAAAHAAERETLEETGYAVRVRPETEFISNYIYNWAERDYHCRTHWFAADLLHPDRDPAPVDDADFIRGVEWISRENIAGELAYHEVIQGDVLRMVNQAFSVEADVNSGATENGATGEW